MKITMIIKTVKTRILKPPKDDLLKVIEKSIKSITEKSIVVITSKPVKSKLPFFSFEIKTKEDLYYPLFSLVPWRDGKRVRK